MSALLNWRRISASVAAVVAVVGCTLLGTIPAAQAAPQTPAVQAVTKLVGTLTRTSTTVCTGTGTLTAKGKAVPNAVIELFRNGIESGLTPTNASGKVTFAVQQVEGGKAIFQLKFPGNSKFLASESGDLTC